MQNVELRRLVQIGLNKDEAPVLPRSTRGGRTRVDEAKPEEGMRV